MKPFGCLVSIMQVSLLRVSWKSNYGKRRRKLDMISVEKNSYSQFGIGKKSTETKS
jgi:hypothetical protein